MPLHRDAHTPDVAPISTHPLTDHIGELPRYRLAESGMPARDAERLVRDELLLDGMAKLNLATFVTTYMEREATELITQTLDKNVIDKDEYPQTAELEKRCVSILGDLWGSPRSGEVVGCSTTGSSEACMLAGMAFKWRWRKRREAAGKDSSKPNLVMGANVQVCWEKFCRYWDVEMRLVPVTAEATHLTPERALAHIDENTIGVVAILGSTYDGTYAPVAAIAAALDELAASGGHDVPLHVDGASGGFVAPFIDPDLEWDFRLSRVASINASGHKYGLVYPGVGWALWRDADALPDELVFHVDYLGGDMPTFALNFSRPGAQVVAQYYTLLRLGREGFARIQQDCRDTADWLAGQISAMPEYELMGGGPGIPAFAFRASDPDALDVHAVSAALRSRGWQVPAYKMPEDIDHIDVLRIVVRNGFTRDMAGLLLEDIRHFTDGPPKLQHPVGDSFHH